MRRFWRWVRWEFGRPIEVTGFIKFIIVERFVKGSALVLGGIAFLVLGETHTLHQIATHIQDELLLSPDKGWVKRLVGNTLVKIGLLSPGTQAIIAIAAFLYGALEIFEGIGLVLRRRWAEYLVLVATAAFLPLEIDEILKHPTFFKAGALLLNVVICAYLIWRKRLFLERPGQEPVADDTRPVPTQAVG